MRIKIEGEEGKEEQRAECARENNNKSKCTIISNSSIPRQVEVCQVGKAFNTLRQLEGLERERKRERGREREEKAERKRTRRNLPSSLISQLLLTSSEVKFTSAYIKYKYGKHYNETRDTQKKEYKK